MGGMKRFYFLSLLLLGCSQTGPIVDPFPPPSEIESIAATIPEAGKDVSFSVPESHWEQIFGALRPARRDYRPSKWEVLGEINLTCKSGKHFYVGLYRADAPGAFSAGDTFES